MTHTLALPKKCYNIHIDNHVIVVMLDNEAPRKKLMEEKATVTIDGKTINFSYVKRVEEINILDDIPGTAKARAEKLSAGQKQVALERIIRYESGGDNMKMSLQKLKSWMTHFMGNMKDDTLSHFYQIYIESGGE